MESEAHGDAPTSSGSGPTETHPSAVSRANTQRGTRAYQRKMAKAMKASSPNKDIGDEIPPPPTYSLPTGSNSSSLPTGSNSSYLPPGSTHSSIHASSHRDRRRNQHLQRQDSENSMELEDMESAVVQPGAFAYSQHNGEMSRREKHDVSRHSEFQGDDHDEFATDATMEDSFARDSSGRPTLPQLSSPTEEEEDSEHAWSESESSNSEETNQVDMNRVGAVSVPHPCNSFNGVREENTRSNFFSEAQSEKSKSKELSANFENPSKAIGGSKRQLLKIGMCIICLGVLIGVVVPLVLGGDEGNDDLTASRIPTKNPTLQPTASPTQNPTTQHPTSLERVDTLTSLLVEKAGISTEAVLANLDNPQSRAMNWLANQDPMELDFEDPSLYDEIVERYLAAVLFFSLGADQAVELEGRLQNEERRPHPIREAFLTGSSVCDWNYDRQDLGVDLSETQQGIFCDNGELMGPLLRINRIELAAVYFKGTIPDEIGLFPSLRVLDFSSNGNIGSTIPSSIGKCTDLRGINLDLNDIEGSIPSTIGSLTLLTSLSLMDNNLSGSLPSTLGGLLQLKSLSLKGNKFEGSLPSSLSQLSNTLMYFNGDRNDFSGSLPSELGELTELEELRLSENSLTSSIPISLGSMSSLRVIRLDANILDGEIPPGLASLALLEEINLGRNFLSGSLPDLSTLTNLESLNLSRNNFEGNLTSFCEANSDRFEQGLITATADCLGKVECSCCERCL